MQVKDASNLFLLATPGIPTNIVNVANPSVEVCLNLVAAVYQALL